MSITLALVLSDKQILAAHWPASPAEILTFKLSDRPCHKGMRPKVAEEDSQRPFSGLYMCVPVGTVMHSHACFSTYIYNPPPTIGSRNKDANFKMTKRQSVP